MAVKKGELRPIKNFVLDTNVLLYDPQAIFKFEDNDVVIPIYVIEEVDQFKRESTERGRNARSISRLLDGLRGRHRRSRERLPRRNAAQSRGLFHSKPR